jgi:hypothetical protein
LNRLGLNSTSTDNDKRGLELAARLLRRLVVGEVPITIEGQVDPEGWVFFWVRFQALKIRPAEFRMIPYYRSCLLSNFIVEILVRKHLDQFSVLLTEIPEDGYHQHIKNLRNTVCGLGIGPDGLRLQFHVSVLYAVINDELRQTVESVEDGSNR